MKIYTKKGDQGETGLVGNKRISKSHHRIEAYGNVDELNSCIGLLGAKITQPEIRTHLQRTQNNCFIIGGMLATPKITTIQVPRLPPEAITHLENAIDRWEEKLPTLKNFILPGGTENAALCHITRSVCRRAERAVVRLHESEPVDEIILQYLNRLSDFLFVLARFINQEEGCEEILWASKT